jgi:hypothetical protein
MSSRRRRQAAAADAEDSDPEGATEIADIEDDEGEEEDEDADDDDEEETGVDQSKGGLDTKESKTEKDLGATSGGHGQSKNDEQLVENSTTLKKGRPKRNPDDIAKKDPTFVPRTGKFFLHDQRDGKKSSDRFADISYILTNFLSVLLQESKQFFQIRQ